MSKSDYGSAVEMAMVARRLDYSEAGTKAVWDVDTLALLVRSYLAEAPDQPIIFAKGQVADAGSAVPGWRMAVDEIFADVQGA